MKKILLLGLLLLIPLAFAAPTYNSCPVCVVTPETHPCDCNGNIIDNNFFCGADGNVYADKISCEAEDPNEVKIICPTCQVPTSNCACGNAPELLAGGIQMCGADFNTYNQQQACNNAVPATPPCLNECSLAQTECSCGNNLIDTNPAYCKTGVLYPDPTSCNAGPNLLKTSVIVNGDNPGHMHVCGDFWSVGVPEVIQYSLCSEMSNNYGDYICSVDENGWGWIDKQTQGVSPIKSGTYTWNTYIAPYMQGLPPGTLICENGQLVQSVIKYSQPPLTAQFECAVTQCHYYDSAAGTSSCVQVGFPTPNEQYTCQQPFTSTTSPTTDAVWVSSVSRLANLMLQNAGNRFILNCGPGGTAPFGINDVAADEEWGYCQLAKLDSSNDPTEIMVGVALASPTGVANIISNEVSLIQTIPSGDPSCGSCSFYSYDTTEEVLYFTDQSALSGSPWSNFWNALQSLFAPSSLVTLTSNAAEYVYIYHDGSTTRQYTVEYGSVDPSLGFGCQGNQVIIGPTGSTFGCYSEKAWRNIIRIR